MQMIRSFFDNLNFGSQTNLILLLAFLILVLYLLPSFIALARHKRQILAICLINLFAGWTAIGWFAALIWAAIVEKSDYEGIQEREDTSKSKKRQILKEVVLEPKNNYAKEVGFNQEVKQKRTLKEFLTKKLSVKGILTQKLW
jgi:hypothetical protein